MTGELFEKLLTLICTFSLTSTGYAVIEKIVHIIDSGRTNQRISAVFFYPNYFGTIVGTVIIICAYKVLTKQNHKWFYYMVAAMNVISMYLCKSMFVWVEVFIGVAVLLVILKRHRLLAIWLFAAALGAFMIFFLDVNIIPRLSDVDVTVKLRRQIWELTTSEIVKAPLFGHGFYSFMYLFDSSYHNQVIPHAHSIYLDMLLNFGVIGSGLIVVYVVRFYKSVTSICFTKKNSMITSLILAVTAAALVHGITDITLLWVQTLPLFLIILSGLGAFEKNGEYCPGKYKTETE
jgi:O-antigen ligase